MKINIVTENFYGYRGKPLFSGGEILLYEYAKLLISRGHYVKVIQYGSESKEFVFDEINIKQIKVPEMGFLSRLGLSRRFHLGGFWWRRALDKDADRIHFHYYYLACPYPQLPNATGMSHGIDWDSPDYMGHISLRAIRDRFSFYLMRLITRHALRKLSKVWSNDMYFIKYIQSTSPHLRDKLEFIPNFVDTKIFNPRVARNTEIENEFQGKRIVLLPKMPSLNRGTDIALKAIKLLNRKDLVLVVVGESSAQEYFKKMADDMEISSQVRFLGHRDHFQDLPGLYNAADVVIIPSPCREAIPLSMLEAMACGRPLVVSNIGGITDAAVNGFNSLVCKPTSESFAKGIGKLLDEPSLSAELGVNATAWVERLFNRNLWEERVLDFFGDGRETK